MRARWKQLILIVASIAGAIYAWRGFVASALLAAFAEPVRRVEFH
jgi:hypothetical protein